MELIMAAAILFLLYNVSVSHSREKRDREKEIPYEVLEMRATQADKIDAWVKSTRTGKARKKIVASWEYVGDTADTIKVRFRGEKDFVIGRLHFLYDSAGPRVSRFTWFDKEGRQRYIAGTTLPQISMYQMESSFRMAKRDARKLRYINQVAREIMKAGTGIFDICVYEGLSEEVFNETFGKREVTALCKALDEFKIVSVNGSKLQVVLAEQPA